MWRYWPSTPQYTRSAIFGKPECEQIYCLLSRIMVSKPWCWRPSLGWASGHGRHTERHWRTLNSIIDTIGWYTSFTQINTNDLLILRLYRMTFQVFISLNITIIVIQSIVYRWYDSNRSKDQKEGPISKMNTRQTVCDAEAASTSGLEVIYHPEGV